MNVDFVEMGSGTKVELRLVSFVHCTMFFFSDVIPTLSLQTSACLRSIQLPALDSEWPCIARYRGERPAISTLCRVIGLVLGVST